ncbi:hypothetical protein F5I97DRAFT_830602 [Phlebopus sp. FC_14]|nr:hypothetical protein F5I97DRAFT_830602 [Phlebopus sp. FC_14]
MPPKNKILPATHRRSGCPLIARPNTAIHRHTSTTKHDDTAITCCLPRTASTRNCAVVHERFCLRCYFQFSPASCCRRHIVTPATCPPPAITLHPPHLRPASIVQVKYYHLLCMSSCCTTRIIACHVCHILASVGIRTRLLYHMTMDWWQNPSHAEDASSKLSFTATRHELSLSLTSLSFWVRSGSTRPNFYCHYLSEADHDHDHDQATEKKKTHN